MGKRLGRLPQGVKCNKANEIQASLSQEVPILDRREWSQGPKKHQWTLKPKCYAIRWLKFSPVSYSFSNTAFTKAFQYPFRLFFLRVKKKGNDITAVVSMHRTNFKTFLHLLIHRYCRESTWLVIRNVMNLGWLETSKTVQTSREQTLFLQES